MSRRSSVSAATRSRNNSFAAKQAPSFLTQQSDQPFSTLLSPEDDPTNPNYKPPVSYEGITIIEPKKDNGKDEAERKRQEEEEAQEKKSEDEDAAWSAFEAITNDLFGSASSPAASPSYPPTSPSFGVATMTKGGTTRTQLGMEDLHQFLGQFGLMSREALKDSNLKITQPPALDQSMVRSPVRSAVDSPNNAAASTAAVPKTSVQQTDFIDFVSNAAQRQREQFAQQQSGSGSTPQRQRRSSSDWINTVVERQLAAQARAAAGMTTTMSNNTNSIGGGGSPGGAMGSDPANVVSIVDPISDPSLVDADGDMFDEHGFYGSSTSMHGSRMSQDPADTLAAIEAKLRAQLDARANTPVPPSLLTEQEIAYQQQHSPSPGGRGAGTPSPERRAATGAMNSMFVPSGQYKPKVSKPRSGAAGGRSPSPDASSPSAILRKHQKAQLEALLEVRRSGGRLLQ